jgi:hypothetical protein
MAATAGPVGAQTLSLSKAAAPASTASVLQTVAAAASIQTVPSSITPPLQDASLDTGITVAAERGCDPAPTVSKTGSCVYGDPKGKKTIVLLGDSHAGMWLAGFDAMAKQAHWKLVLLMKTECPAVDTSFWIDSLNRAYPECNTWHKYVVKRINKLDPAVVVISNWWAGNSNSQDQPITDAEWEAGLETMVKSLDSPATAKVLWGDIPYLSQPGPTCLSAHLSNAQACTTPTSAAVLTLHGQELAALATTVGATYISTTPWFCTSQCTAIIGDYDVYANASHITNTYARYLSGAIGAALAPVMGSS